MDHHQLKDVWNTDQRMVIGSVSAQSTKFIHVMIMKKCVKNSDSNISCRITHFLRRFYLEAVGDISITFSMMVKVF